MGAFDALCEGTNPVFPTLPWSLVGCDIATAEEPSPRNGA